MKKLEGSITISRPTYGDGRENIVIRVKDILSVCGFLEVVVGLREFTMALTGLAEVEAQLYVRGLDNVGLVRLRESRQIVCPLEHAGRNSLENWLLENAHEESWTIDPYLGSKNSVGRDEEGKTLLRYAVYKYVEPEKEE